MTRKKQEPTDKVIDIGAFTKKDAEMYLVCLSCAWHFEKVVRLDSENINDFHDCPRCSEDNCIVLNEVIPDE